MQLVFVGVEQVYSTSCLTLRSLLLLMLKPLDFQVTRPALLSKTGRLHIL